MIRVLEIRDLTKIYNKEIIALDHVSIDVYEREIYGLLGPNGAGKTTLFRILAGILDPTDGEVKILGRDPRDLTIRRYIGYCPQEYSAYELLTGYENILFYMRLYGIEGEEAHNKTVELLELVGLRESMNRKVKTYSGGMKQRLNLAIALVGDPRILLLDEPTVGMDPNMRREIWGLISKLREEGITILLATHYMEEAEELCDRVSIIDEGKIVATGTPLELKERLGLRSVLNLKVEGDLKKASKLLRERYQIDKILVEEDKLRIFIDDPYTKSPDILNFLFENGFKIPFMEISPPTLEDVFISITGKRLET